MQSMNFIGQILFLMLGVVISLQAVPPVLNYAGQVAVNGQPFEGEGLFKFALVNANGDITYWSNDGTSVNGSEPQASVKAPVSGGLYSLLLGNTAIPGMGAINPTVFAQHSDAKLRVWFSDGVNGFQQLSPDRPFASVPYAFSAGTAQSVTIADGSISKSMLGSDVLTDLNAPIGLNRLSAEVTAKLDQNGSGGSGVVAGSLISIPSGQPAPAGYSLFQRGEPKLVWKEKASVSVARHAYDGVEVLDGKIYFVGGNNGSVNNIAERYDPTTNTWETLPSMSVARKGVACAVLNGKFYAIGGQDVSSVEIYDPSTASWSSGVALPSEVNHGTAITADGKIYLIGGRNASDQIINQVLCFDPSSNQWQVKASIPTAKYGTKLVRFENRIWAIGGVNGNSLINVESYEPISDSWQTEASLPIALHFSAVWVANNNIFVCGGNYKSSIVTYNPISKLWSNIGQFPENRHGADAVVLNDQVYVVAGQTSIGVYSNKVFAADLNASVAGIYDLYRKDGNASAGTPLVQAEVADGSVTMAKFEPQLRADLNKTTSRPFGATLANPYGIMGTPITGRTYTVPSGKVLVITSSGSYVGVHAARFRNADSPPSFISAGEEVTIPSGYNWTGYLFSNLPGITPKTGDTTYTVPSGKVLVITSSGSYVSVNSTRFRNADSPPSVIPAGEEVTIPSGYRWSGYLINPTKF